MTGMIRSMGFAVAVALVSTAAGAQQHDMSKMRKDTTKRDSMAGMKHEMPGMKHDMSMMKGDTGKMKMKMDMNMTSGWPELDATHALLMATWHPAQKDSLAMARAKSGEMLAAVNAWVASKGPAACDNAAARALLPAIAADAKAFAAGAKAGSDADVKAALKKVHDGFEKAAMPCMMGAMKGMKGMKP